MFISVKLTRGGLWSSVLCVKLAELQSPVIQTLTWALLWQVLCRCSWHLQSLTFFILTQGHAYWFLERGEGRKIKRETDIYVRQKYQWVGCLLYGHPDQGTNSQLRHVLWPGPSPRPFCLQGDAPPTVPPLAGASWLLNRGDYSCDSWEASPNQLRP